MPIILLNDDQLILPYQLGNEIYFRAATGVPGNWQLSIEVVNAAHVLANLSVDPQMSYVDLGFKQDNDDAARLLANVIQARSQSAQSTAEEKMQVETPPPQQPQFPGPQISSVSPPNLFVSPAIAQAQQQQHADVFKQRRYSASRWEMNTAVPGFRFGVATWNLHGFQKKAKTTVKEAIDYTTPATQMMGKERGREAVRAYARQHLPQQNQESIEGFLRLFDNAHDSGFARYVREIASKFKFFTGVDVFDISKAPAVDMTTFNPGAELDRLNSWFPAGLSDCYRSLKQCLLKHTATAAIKAFFETNKWLDAIVLQEVKYSGIEVLEQLAAEYGFELWRGPLLKGSNEVEYYPLALRKNCASFNNGGQTLSVKRIWWIRTDGTTGEMGNLAEKRTDAKPHVTWSKKKGTNRPVVVYDIEIGANSNKIVHLGVIHTTPSQSEVALSKREQASIRRVQQKGNGRVRTGQLASMEFQRFNQFAQLKAAFDKVASESYSANGPFSGPWILAGDYYLFRESRAVDLDTLFDTDNDLFQEPYQSNLRDEFLDLLSTLRERRANKNKFAELAWNWYVRRTRAESDEQNDRVPRQTPIELIHMLVEENRALAAAMTQAEAGIRQIIRKHRHDWLTPSRVVNRLANGELWNHGAERSLDRVSALMLDAHRNRWVNICEAREDMYRELAILCDDSGEDAKILEQANVQNPISILNQLREYNKRVMERSVTKLPPSAEKKKTKVKTIQNIGYVAKEDPMRNTLGITFERRLDGKLEIVQAVSGSNLNKFEEFSRFRHDEQEEGKPLDFFATRIKVADFFINTYFNRQSGFGTNHWAANCVGILCPALGRMSLTDTPTLDLSKFWSAVSDHFPIGAYYSTDIAPGEVDSLRNDALVSLGTVTSAEVVELVERMDRERRLEKVAELRTLACLLTTPDDTEFQEALQRDAGSLTNTQLDGLIWDLEEWLDVPHDDQFGEIQLELHDFEGAGVL